MFDLLSIGEMAEMNHVSVKALRLYQEKGLLVPERVDEHSKRRYYHISQSGRLDLIVHLQQIGFSLEEIGQVIEARDIDSLLEMANRHKEKIDGQLRQLELAKHAANRLIESCSMHANRPIVGEYFLENLPERSIVKFDRVDMDVCDYPLGTQRYFEWLFRETKRLAIKRSIPLSVFHDVCSIYQCDPGAAPDAPFEVTSTFLILDDPIDIKGAETLPGGTHATIYLDKAYDLDSNDNNISFAYGSKMLDYVEEKGFETRGAMYGEPLCRYSRMLDESGNMLFRMCVPIKPRKDPPRG